MQRLTRQHGFTLIELLAASAITAFIALVAVTSVKSVTAGRERIDQYSQANGDLRYAIETIRKDMLNFYRQPDPAARIFSGTVIPVEQDGEEQPYATLRFQTVSRTPARPLQPEGEVYEVEYLVTRNEEQPELPLKLMRRVQPNPLNAPTRGGMLAVLCDPILRFDAVYFDTTTQEWLTEWPTGRQDLPGMIKIKLTGTTPNGKYTLTRSAIIDLPRWPQAPEAASGGTGSNGGNGGGAGNRNGGGGNRGEGGEGQATGTPSGDESNGSRGRGGRGGGNGGGGGGRGGGNGGGGRGGRGGQRP